MWVKTAAIRPVPDFARIPQHALEEVEAWLGGVQVETPGSGLGRAELGRAEPDRTERLGDENVSERRLNDVFERFEHEQPILAERIGDQLTHTTDEVALALGYFLCLCVWLTFDRHFGKRMAIVTRTAITSVEQALELDETLRGEDPMAAVDSDDVVAMEQPFLVAFIGEHIEAAIEVHAIDVNVDAVHRIYRLTLIELLALSYAVEPPDGDMAPTGEIFA